MLTCAGPPERVGFADARPGRGCARRPGPVRLLYIGRNLIAPNVLEIGVRRRTGFPLEVARLDLGLVGASLNGWYAVCRHDEPGLLRSRHPRRLLVTANRTI